MDSGQSERKWRRVSDSKLPCFKQNTQQVYRESGKLSQQSPARNPCPPQNKRNTTMEQSKGKFAHVNRSEMPLRI